MKSAPIYMIGTQGRSVTSGPGTFMRYICQAVADGDLSAEVFFPHSEGGSDFRQFSFVSFSEPGEKFYHRFFGSWIVSSFYVWRYLVRSGARENKRAIWFADRYSALFCVMDPRLRPQCFAMVNDDTRIKRQQPMEAASDPFLERLAHQILGGVMHYFERFIVRRSRFVVSNSDYLSQQIERCYRTPRERVVRLYKAVDLSLFQSRDSRLFEKEPFTVLFIKNEWFRGGLDVLIRALAEITEYRFVLKVVGISDRSAQEQIKEIAEKSKLKHELKLGGTASRQDIVELLQTSDLLCVPSRKEALGVALLEGLATGVPVISTNVGGIPEVLNGGLAGVMVPPEDVATLRDAIISNIEIESGRSGRVAEGKRHVARFSRAVMIEAIRELSAKVSDDVQW